MGIDVNIVEKFLKRIGSIFFIEKFNPVEHRLVSLMGEREYLRRNLHMTTPYLKEKCEKRIEEITKKITELEGKAEKALVDLTYLTNTLRETFLTPTAHGGRYINSLKKQNVFANRRNRTTLKGKRRQTKRSKKGKREKLTKRKKMNN